jgi:hypothetical protein
VLQILRGGHTFKNDDAERETMVLNIKNNPFKQNDLKLQALKLQEGGADAPPPSPVSPKPPRAGHERESEFKREEMVQRSVTIANPPEQELVLVFDSSEQRDRLFTVLCRHARQFSAPAADTTA